MDVLKVVKRSPIVLPLACAAAAAMVFTSEGSYWRSVSTLNEMSVMQASRVSILGLAQGILDAETGQRGYLLTGRKEYLQPYEKALRKIDESFALLDRYYADNPAQQGVLKQLKALVETKLSELALTIHLHDEGRVVAATELVLSDIGKEKMEAIKALSAQLVAHESLNLVSGRGELDRTLLLGRIGMAALSSISLLALFLYVRKTSALEEHEEEQNRLIQAERDRLEVEVRLRTNQLTELAHHLLTAREDERSRLARNLHDELGALLTSAKLDAARIRSRLAGGSPEALERLNHMVEVLNSSIALGRRIIEDLRPSTLSNLGLVATLEILARDFAAQSGIAVHCELAPVRLKASSELTVYRVVQEAITNIAKYAQAREVWLDMAAQGGQVVVVVRDDGVGFEPSAKPSSTYGLLGMRFRVEAEGGMLSLVSTPGQGTRIQVKLPEAAQEQTTERAMEHLTGAT